MSINNSNLSQDDGEVNSETDDESDNFMYENNMSASEKSPLVSSQDKHGSSSESLDSRDENVFCSCINTRTVLAIMSFLGFVNVYCLRVNLSVALVAMINNTGLDNSNKTVTEECPGDVVNSTSPSTHPGEFHWDQTTQGVILGSFFYGYITTQLPGGWLAEKVGGRRLFGYGILCTSLLTLLTPVVARWSLPGLIVLRVVEGIGEGVTFPAMHAMWGSWAPLLERSKLVSISYSGAQLGTVISMPISGLLCDYGFAGGWPSVFYVFGALGCIWVFFWMFIVYDHPSKHPRISKSERLYIESTTGKRENTTTPWKSIFTSGPLWGIAAGHFANNWGMYSMLTCLPTYMKEILKFDIKANGILSALPYLALWLLQLISGFIADWLRGRGILNTNKTRKLMNTLGLLIPAVFMIGVSYSGCDHTLAVVLLIFAVGTGGFSMAGYQVNHLDIAPRFAGSLMGITNMIATIPGFLAPLVVGILTDHQETSGQWRIFFFITAAIYIVGAILFLALSKGEELAWAKTRELENLIEKSVQSNVLPYDSDRTNLLHNKDI